jgi:hypothetical protein
LFAIIAFSLLFNTSGLKEGFFPSEAQPFSESNDYIEGTPSGTSLSMFAENKVSAECCPSTYTTSNGCVCLTSAQLKQIQNRGGNRSDY